MITIPRRLPLTVIGGFLGAGKTTLLNHWLRHAGGQRLAVLVNDFGALNIDAALIEASASDTIALTNGCVCCQIGDDLSMALAKVLDTGASFDGVVIEASGVSDPWRIAQFGRADPGFGLDGVIVLVDASVALAQSRDPLLADTLARQLEAADLVVVNKTDLVNADERVRLRDWINAVAGAVPQFETTQAVVPLSMLTGLAMPTVDEVGERETCDGAHDEAHDKHSHDHAYGHIDHTYHTDHGAVFDTWSCRPTQALDPSSLRAWLNAPPPGLLRLKGILRTAQVEGGNAWSEIQFAGRRGSLRPLPTDLTIPETSAVVAIGLRGHLPVAALEATFAVELDASLIPVSARRTRAA